MCQTSPDASSSVWRFVPVGPYNHDGQGTNLALPRPGARASSLQAPHKTQTNILLHSRAVPRVSSVHGVHSCQQISWDALQLHTPPSPSRAAWEMLLLLEQTLAPIALTSSNYCTDKIKVLSCFANIFEAPIQQQK